MGDLMLIAQFLYNAKDPMVFRDVFGALSVPQREQIGHILFESHNQTVLDYLTWAETQTEPLYFEFRTWGQIIAHAMLQAGWATHYKVVQLFSLEQRLQIKQVLSSFASAEAYAALKRLAMAEQMVELRYTPQPMVPSF